MEQEERIALLKQAFVDQLERAQEAAEYRGQTIHEIRDMVTAVLAENKDIIDLASANKLVKQALKGLMDGEESVEGEIPAPDEAEEVHAEAVMPPTRRPERKSFRQVLERIGGLNLFIIGLVVLLFALSAVYFFTRQKGVQSPTGQVAPGQAEPILAISQEMAMQKTVIQEAWNRISNSFRLGYEKDGIWPRAFNAKIGGEILIPQYLSLRDLTWEADFGGGRKEIVTDLLVPLKEFFETIRELDKNGKKNEAVAYANILQAKWELVPLDEKKQPLPKESWSEKDNVLWPVALIDKIVGDQPLTDETTQPVSIPTPVPEPIVLPTPQPQSAASLGSQTGGQTGQSGSQASGQTQQQATKVPLPTGAPAAVIPTATPVSQPTVDIPTLPTIEPGTFYVPYNASSAKMGGEKYGLNKEEAYNSIYIWFYSQTGVAPNVVWITQKMAAAERDGGNLENAYKEIVAMDPVVYPTQVLKASPTPKSQYVLPAAKPTPTVWIPNWVANDVWPYQPTPLPTVWIPPIVKSTTIVPQPTVVFLPPIVRNPTPLPTWAPGETPVGRF